MRATSQQLREPLVSQSLVDERLAQATAKAIQFATFKTTSWLRVIATVPKTIVVCSTRHNNDVDGHMNADAAGTGVYRVDVCAW